MVLNLPELSGVVQGERERAQLPQAGQGPSQWFCVSGDMCLQVNAPLMGSRLAVVKADLPQGPCIFSHVTHLYLTGTCVLSHYR